MNLFRNFQGHVEVLQRPWKFGFLSKTVLGTNIFENINFFLITLVRVRKRI